MSTERQFARLAKAFVDLERDPSVEDAVERLRGVQPQVLMTPDADGSESWQTCALTIAETAVRAFPAGVRFVFDRRVPCLPPHLDGQELTETLESLGVTIVQSVDPESACIIVGEGEVPITRGLVLRASVRGWSGGVIPGGADLLEFRPGVLGAILAGAIAVSEIFLATHNLELRAGFRRCGVSAWAPDLNWESDEAVGPQLAHLPANAWFVGLGHLGQAYAWVLRSLPYQAFGSVAVALQDDDVVDDENLCTSILASPANVGLQKTRVVMAALEGAGFKTQVVERRMDERQRLQPGEPTFAIAGLDSPSARMPLGDVGWSTLLDVGLGAGARNFTQMTIQRLTDLRRSEVIFDVPSDDDAEALIDQNPYYAALLSEGSDRCGVVQAAGEAVGTSFVGAVASAIVIGEAIRPLHGGPSFDVLGLDLRDPMSIVAANRDVESISAPAWVGARSLAEH